MTRLFNVPPASSVNNSLCGRYSKDPVDFFLLHSAFMIKKANRRNYFFRHHGAVVLVAALNQAHSGSVPSVFKATAPFKIAQFIISLYAVFMINLRKICGIRDESLCKKAVVISGEGHAVLPEGHKPITIVAVIERFLRGKFSVMALNGKYLAHFVYFITALESRYCGPFHDMTIYTPSMRSQR